MAFNIIKSLRGFGDTPVAEPDETGFTETFPNTTTYRYSQMVSVVYSCTGLIANLIAGQRIVIRDQDGMVIPIHNVSTLLNNPERRIMDKNQYWTWGVLAMLQGGASYSVIERETMTGTSQGIRLHPAIFHGVQAGPSGKIYFRLCLVSDYIAHNSSNVNLYSAEDVLIMACDGFNGCTAPSPIQYAAQGSERILREAAKYNFDGLTSGFGKKSFVENSAQLAEVIDGQGNSKKQKLQNVVNKLLADAYQERSIPVLPAGLSINTDANVSARDMDLINLMEWSAVDIARIFKVPNRMVVVEKGIRQGGTTEQQSADLLKYTLRPWMDKILSQCNMKLLNDDQKDAGQYVDFDTDNIELGTFTERVQAAVAAVSNGGLATRNEGRKLLRLPPRQEAAANILLDPKGAPPQQPTGNANAEE